MSAPDWLITAISAAKKGLVTTCHQSQNPAVVTTSKTEILAVTGLAGFVTTVTTVTTKKQSPVGIFSEKPVPVVDSAWESLPPYPDANESEPAANDPDPTVHYGWIVHFTDRDPAFVTFSPEANHAEVLKAYPDAVAAEPSAGHLQIVSSDRYAVTPQASQDTDDRITCTACQHYTYGGICAIARPGGTVSAIRGYHPAMPDTLQRCDGYQAKPEKGQHHD